MADQHHILVECPSCKQPGFLASWPYIVSSRDTQARDLLLRGKLFKYTCPVCDTTAAMAYECLYQDVEHKTLLLYSPNCGTGANCRELLDALAQQANGPDVFNLASYQHRIVRTTFEFCEKARLLDEGYDDRVIELMKVAIKRGMLQDGIIGPRDILTYERTMPDGGVSFIVSGEIPGDVVGVPQGYEYMKREWGQAVDAVEGEYHFDAAWANAFLP